MSAVASGGLSALEAMTAALRADAQLLAWLGVPNDAVDEATRVFDTYAPSVLVEDEDGIATPYVTVVVPRNSAFGTFDKPGAQTVAEVRVWVPRTLAALALAGAVHIERVLDGANLTLSGHVSLGCDAEEVLVQPDLDNAATQALTRIRIFTQASS